jgi:hypothetical protein
MKPNHFWYSPWASWDVILEGRVWPAGLLLIHDDDDDYDDYDDDDDDYDDDDVEFFKALNFIQAQDFILESAAR